MLYIRDAQPAARVPEPAPNVLYPAFGAGLKHKKLFPNDVNDGFVWMNLNFIELLTILQLNTIWNSSDGKNIKPQAIKRL